MTIVYVVLEEYSGPELKWENGKIYSSVDNALKYFEKYNNSCTKIKIVDCAYDEYFSRDRGLLNKITIQNYLRRIRTFYIKEVVVE